MGRRGVYMSKEGRIIKIAGPLVVAQGIPRARMFDVVRVGKERLIGEILEIRGDNASIQVYEETGGLKPGEPVESTYQPLSVELAPGILGNIYDGIQRPLDLIMAMKGDFISRGIELPAIDREKEWDFKPTVKEGEKVTAGDILGVVQETEIIEHRILVPFGIEGKIEKIREGKVKVEDTIAVIRTPEGKEKEISVLQRWPVRKMRPYKKQLNPEEPLITGQRVIDTFFPIAKGGTACIPGPFGSGKCVSGRTPILMGDGGILTIRALFQFAKRKGKQIKGEKFEEIYDISEWHNPSLISLNSEKFEVCKPITAYKGFTDSIVCIHTRTGKKVEITPIHQLFTLNDGKLEEKRAEEIKPGNYLATPRHIDLNLPLYTLPLLDILADSNLYSCDLEINMIARKYLKSLIKEGKVEKKTRQYLRKDRNVPFNLLTCIKEKFSVSLIPKKVCSFHGKKITLPQKVTPEFSEFLAYVMADGNLKRSGYSIRFYNASPEVLDRFCKLAQDLFGIAPRVYPHPRGGRAFIAQIDCKAVFELLRGLGIPYIQKAKNAHIPECVLKSSDECIASFLWEYIVCDGSIDKEGSRVEITSASRKLIEELSLCLPRLGIISSIGKRKADGTFRLWINSSQQLQNLLNMVKIRGEKRELLAQAIKRVKGRWSSIDAFPIPSFFRQFLKGPGILSYLKDKGIHAESCAYNQKKIGTHTLLRIVNTLRHNFSIPPEVEKLSNLIQEVFFDEVTKIERVFQKTEVYDLEVPRMANFVGGHGPILLHNTVVQHQLSKWVDADIIVFTACGERGNEVADVLREFPKLKDPKTGKSLMQRTVLIANTSNMPVAAREASIYTGITLAEYYRDMGYDVALMADSTSRWAEALREMSGRLEEMPGEEGYPAYLPSRLAEFYERAGRIICLGRDERKASLSAIGAVSPPGGDLSEPVTQATLRVVRVFWALVAELAYQRHFPAIHWLRSYSLYLDNLKGYFTREVAADWMDLRTRAMALLQKEDELKETARLVGLDALSNQDRVAMETARSLREDFLQQFAFHPIDTYASIKKQYLMLKMVLNYYDECITALKKGASLKDLTSLPVREDIAKAKYISDKEVEKEMEKINQKLKAEINDLITKTGGTV